jgi:hypothetical protein
VGIAKVCVNIWVHNACIACDVHWEFQLTMWILWEPCRYCILGFCSMMNVFRIMNFLGARICSISFQSWEGFQNPIPIMYKTPPNPPFTNKDLVWMSRIRHGGKNNVNIQFNYVPYACISKFLEGERGDTCTLVEWNVCQNFPSQTDVKQPTIKTHLGHMW